MSQNDLFNAANYLDADEPLIANASEYIDIEEILSELERLEKENPEAISVGGLDMSAGLGDTTAEIPDGLAVTGNEEFPVAPIADFADHNAGAAGEEVFSDEGDPRNAEGATLTGADNTQAGGGADNTQAGGAGDGADKQPGLFSILMAALTKPFRLIGTAFKPVYLARAGLAAAVVAVCAAAGYFGVMFISSAFTADTAEQPAPVYTATPHLYDFGGAIQRFAEQNHGDHAGDIVNAPEPEPEDENAYRGLSVMKLLYPDMDVLTESSYMNFLSYMTERMSESEQSMEGDQQYNGVTTGAVPDLSADSADQAGDPNPTDDANLTGNPPANDPNPEDDALSGGIPDLPTDGADQAGDPNPANDAAPGDAGPVGDAGPEGDAASVTPPAHSPYTPGAHTPTPANPTIPVTNPFPINVLSFNTVDDVLMSGNLRLKNNSDYSIDNAFFLITLSYGQPGSGTSGDIKMQYAYTKFTDILPGEEKTVSYATIPPVKGDTPFTLVDITLTAFDTHIDGEPFKIYNDTDRSYLEVLAVGVY